MGDLTGSKVALERREESERQNTERDVLQAGTTYGALSWRTGQYRRVYTATTQH